MTWPVDVTDYVLGELPADERAVADDLMATDAAFRAEVEHLSPLVAQLENLPSDAWEGVAPPAAAAAPVHRSWWERIWPERVVVRPSFALAASVALIAVGVGVGALVASRDDAPAGRDIALAPLDAAGANARAVATVSNGRLRIDVSGVEPSPEGRFYELWLLNSPTDLVGVASFKVPASGRTTVTVPLPDDPSKYTFLDLSVEPADGNPAHSGKSVLRGETTTT